MKKEAIKKLMKSGMKSYKDGKKMERSMGNAKMKALKKMC